MKYQYLKGDVLNDRISYFYSKYDGYKFLEAWEHSRNSCLGILPKVDSFRIQRLTRQNHHNLSESESLLDNWISDMRNNTFNYVRFDLLLKRFEVTKRLFNKYDKNFRPIDKQDFFNKTLYIMFGYLLVLAFEKTNKLQYLNSLLKLNDILCSLINSLPDNTRDGLAWLIINEKKIVKELSLRRKT